MIQNVAIFGSTGSIGTQTLEVIDKIDGFRVYALTCGKNINLLKKQIEKYKPKYVCIQDENDIKDLKNYNIKILIGNDGLIEIADDDNIDTFVIATSGIVSVKAVLRAIQNKKKIALANKETLVMAGDIVTKAAKNNNVNIIPIDSEHSAILQCLNSKENKFAKRLWITASGGPFLNNTREEMANFSVKEALNHPRWKMGKKITLDCSTLVNKGLEVIEAHHLYDFDYENIKVVIHPQSLVHSFVEFIDGSFLAQMGMASMHIPIQYALTFPNRAIGIKTDSFSPFNKKLEFFEPDLEKFPLLKLTIDCGKSGGIMPAVLNAINEIAVYKFLKEEINFLDIEKMVYKEVENTKNILNPTLDDIFAVDKEIRNRYGY